MIEVDKKGLTTSAKKLRIKIPTAKVIMASYRNRGLIFQRK